MVATMPVSLENRIAVPISVVNEINGELVESRE